MADSKISGTSELAATPSSGDKISLVDVSDTSMAATGTNKWLNAARIAYLAAANTFTATQTFAPANTAHHGIVANMPTSASGYALLTQYNSANRQYALASSTTNGYVVAQADLGSNYGPYVSVERNSNASTPAAGFIYATNRAGTGYAIWVDGSGNLRLGTTLPTNANDASGTVAGTQSSSLDTKDVLGEFTDYDHALQAILDAPLYDFTYKSGAFNGQQFTGIITDRSPVFGMDRDEDHPAGKSLNEITAHGYEMAAIKALCQRLKRLEAEIATLRQMIS